MAVLRGGFSYLQTVVALTDCGFFWVMLPETLDDIYTVFRVRKMIGILITGIWELHELTQATTPRGIQSQGAGVLPAVISFHPLCRQPGSSLLASQTFSRCPV